MDLEARISRLEAIEAIKGIISRYAQGADRKNDPVIMRALFTEDGIWESAGFGRFEGGDIIAQKLHEVAQSQITWTLHYMTSPLIAIDKDLKSARGSWLLWEPAKFMENGREVAVWTGGAYDACFVQEKGEWKINRLRLEIKLLAPFDQGWLEKPVWENLS